MSLKAEDIRKESLISKKWNFKKTFLSDYPDGVLITGANSFIGVHVVKSLLEHDMGPLHLLLRATTVPEALARMRQACHNWGLEDFEADKITIHLGDVSRNMMGLSHSEFRSLSSSTGAVIHLAMTPLYHLPYHHFQRVWIPELDRMIAFCGDKEHPKSLHYASSFNANFFQTDDDFAALNTNAWQSGYAGFKWVAWKSLQNAMKQNLRGCIYDIPLVLGSESTGACPIHYSIWLILDIFLKTGMYFPFSFRIIPVDILAGIIVHNIFKEKTGESSMFLRPMLDEPVTDGMFSKTVTSILGLRNEEMETVREACLNKLRFDFMMPGNFYDLLEKVNQLPLILPAGYYEVKLLSILGVFMSNLNRIMANRKELVK